MIRGQKRALRDIEKIDIKQEMPQVKSEAKFNIHNRFDIEVIDSNTGEIKQKAFAENIVLDALWTRLLAPNTYFNRIHFGSGTGTLSASRTSLFTFLGAKAVGAATLNIDSQKNWVSFLRTIQIAENEYIGSEIKEVGIGYGSESTNLVTHALLKDMNGNPISIFKTDTDIVNVFATVFIYLNYTELENKGIRFFVNYSAISDSSALSEWSLFYYLGGIRSTLPDVLRMWEGDAVRTLPGISPLIEKTPTWTYNIQNKKISISTLRLTVNEANVNGIKEISILNGYESPHYSTYNLPNIIFSVGGTDGWYKKTTITGESIGTGDNITLGFKTKFPFIKSGAKIYVDGVEQFSGVTLNTGKPNKQDITSYMKVIECSFRRPVYPEGNALIPVPGFNYGLASWSNKSTYGNYCIFENPFCTDGIDSCYIYGVDLYSSDDIINWSLVSNWWDTINIPSQHRTKRYWKSVVKEMGYGPVNGRLDTFLCTSFNDYKNIIFDTAPANGAVITADYDCEVIAKDANHVFDFSFEITLAEKTS
jgi:hypothetical protein